MLKPIYLYDRILTEMKNSNILAGAAVMAAVALTGCSVFGKQAVMPAQPERPITEAQKTPAVTENLAQTIAGEWIITEVADQKIIRDDNMPYLNFVPTEGRFYGSNGCNVLNGSYKIENNTLSFGGVLATMRACQDAQLEADINAVVRDDVTIQVMAKKIGNETYLYFNDRTGKALMTLVRHSMQFLNGNWQITAINGRDINDDEANIFFDIAELKVHGNTGCNYFNGQILIDPGMPNSISLSGMAVTRMACPKSDQERTMLVALEETASCVLDGPNRALMIDAAGNPLLRLERLD